LFSSIDILRGSWLIRRGEIFGEQAYNELTKAQARMSTNVVAASKLQGHFGFSEILCTICRPAASRWPS